MRLINLSGRLKIVVDGLAVDVEKASNHRFSSQPQEIFARWEEFTGWAGSADLSGGDPIAEAEIGPPVPRPPQIFAVGINYRDHMEEAGLQPPDAPFVFTKFPSAITGPYGAIELPNGSVDWEVELVAVIGKLARHVDERKGWEYVAGLTVGQDLSERELQLSGPPPQQFNLGKSYAGFAPIGPALVTIDELADPNDVEVSTTLSGEVMQQSRTANLIFPVPRIVAYLSEILPLLPGDLIFTGTPSGIGWARDPKRLITAADELVTRVSGIGEMRHRFTSTGAGLSLREAALMSDITVPALIVGGGGCGLTTSLPESDMHVHTVSHWILEGVLVQRYRVGRVLLAGDAARRHPPTTANAWRFRSRSSCRYSPLTEARRTLQFSSWSEPFRSPNSAGGSAS